MEIYKRNILRIINSYGFATQNYPFLDLIISDEKFRTLFNELIEDDEIVELKNSLGFVSREVFRKYELIKANSKSQKLLNSRKLNANKVEKIKLFHSISKKNIIFDLGGVIADESELDVLICNFFDKNVKWDNFQWNNYTEYSEDLEIMQSPKWYDYYGQADELSIERAKIDKLHIDNIGLVHFFNNSVEYVKKLHEKGYKIFFMTGCNSKVLKLRLSIYSLSNYVSGFITSDQSNEIGNKENYFEIFFKKFRISPEDCIFITDNFIKDGLPAKKHNVETLLFIAGGRSNTTFNSQGLKPNDILTFSLLLHNCDNKPISIFDSFNDLIEVIKTLPNKS